MIRIPMLDLRREYTFMKKEIDAALKRCLEHQGWIMGPEVKQAEEALSQYLGSGECIGVSSGTEALVLALRALAITTKGEEYFSREDGIITTTFTFTATGDAILRAGATPVFVDVDPVSCTLDHEALGRFMEGGHGGLKIRGVILVHLYGQVCEMDEIMKTAREYGLFVVEDVAQSFGAEYGGRKAGTIGDAGAFSFFPSKNLGCFGDGGMIATGNPGIAEMVRMLLKHGGRDKYNVDHIGYNARLDTIQSAVLLVKLGYIDEFNRRRRRTASIYRKELAGTKGISTTVSSRQRENGDDLHHVYHQFTLRAGHRDELRAFLGERGISSMVYYPVPLHRMKVFSSRSVLAGSLENAEKAASEVVSLPIGPLQEDGETCAVAGVVREFYESSQERMTLHCCPAAECR